MLFYLTLTFLVVVDAGGDRFLEPPENCSTLNLLQRGASILSGTHPVKSIGAKTVEGHQEDVVKQLDEIRKLIKGEQPKRKETAAEASGVTENSAGDLNAFVAALLTNIATVIVFFAAASLLRQRYPLVYCKNALTLKDVKELADEITSGELNPQPVLDEDWRSKVPFMPEDGYLGWWRASAEVTIDKVVEFRGLDQALLLEFSQIAMKILAIISVPLVFVLGPCHCFLGGYRAGKPGELGTDYLSYWGLANVVDKHPWLYKVHAVVVWFVIVTVQRLIFGAMRDFMTRRQQWLRALPAPRSTTIMVEGIPETYRHDDKLKAYFDALFGHGVVKEAVVIKDTTQLLQTVRMAGVIEADIQKLKQQMKQPTQDTAGNHKRAAELREDLVAINQQIELQRQAVLQAAVAETDSTEPVVNLSTGFVTFETRRDAELAKTMVLTADEAEFVVSTPPDPSDIIYADLQKDPMAETAQMLIGYLLLVIVFWAYLPTVVSVAYFSSLETLAEHHFPGAETLLKDETLTAIWDGTVSAIALQVFISFVPTFFVAIFQNFFVLKAEAWVQQKIQVWYFYFQVLFVLLVTAIGSSLIDTTKEIAEDPFSVFSLLAETLPLATHFYLSYLPLQWAGHAQNLLRLVNLFKFQALRVVYGKAAASQKCEPEDQDYYGIGSRSARFAFMLTMTLSLCSLSPVIVLLGFVNFWMCRTVYGYLCVFSESKKADLGGVFFVAQLRHVQQGLFIYIILMTGVLMQRDRDWWPGMLAAGGLIFQYISYSKFQSTFRWETLSFEQLTDIEMKDEEGDVHYGQPELIATR